MKRQAAAVIVLLAAGSDVQAHRLDEYLQAIRVSFARNQLALDVDLTPGASIASSIIAALDTNADGSIAAAEGEAYGRVVLSDLLVTLDGDRVAMTLDGVEMPTIDEMHNGMGVIRLRTIAGIEVGTGHHSVQLVNNHRPETSVYIVNALVPDDSAVDVVSQTRDPRQREFRADYEVTSPVVRDFIWLGFGAAVVIAAFRVRKRRKEQRGAEAIETP